MFVRNEQFKRKKRKGSLRVFDIIDIFLFLKNLGILCETMFDIAGESWVHDAKWISRMTKYQTNQILVKMFRARPARAAKMAKRKLRYRLRGTSIGNIRYAMFWEARARCDYIPTDAVLCTADAPEIAVHTVEVGCSICAPGVPVFVDPKGIVFYKALNYGYYSSVVSVFVLKEFKRRFSHVLIPELLQLVHGYWYEPPTV